jgi:hypothetical protein
MNMECENRMLYRTIDFLLFACKRHVDHSLENKVIYEWFLFVHNLNTTNKNWLWFSYIFQLKINPKNKKSWKNYVQIKTTASHWQILSHNVVSSTPRLRWIQTYNVSGDRHWLITYVVVTPRTYNVGGDRHWLIAYVVVTPRTYNVGGDRPVNAYHH